MEDTRPYMLLVKESLLKCEIVRGEEHLKDPSVVKWERDLVESLGRFRGSFSRGGVVVENSGGEVLVKEQLGACEVCLNNPVSYVTGFPGSGKTSVLTKLLGCSNGTLA